MTEKKLVEAKSSKREDIWRQQVKNQERREKARNKILCSSIYSCFSFRSVLADARKYIVKYFVISKYTVNRKALI